MRSLNDYEGSFNVLYDTSNHLRFENITKICTVDHKDGVYMYIYVYVYIYIIVEKSPISSHMYDHGFMDNTNRQAVCKSQKIL